MATHHARAGAIGGLMKFALHGADTAPARRGRWESLLAKIEAVSPGLPQDEKARRAKALECAENRQAALKAVKARQAKRARAMRRAETSRLTAINRK